jgi:hypothetical protein
MLVALIRGKDARMNPARDEVIQIGERQGKSRTAGDQGDRGRHRREKP